ncbi:MAG: hypothetical protein AAFY04_05285, partial [Pseudomonadota bacterium]
KGSTMTSSDIPVRSLSFGTVFKILFWASMLFWTMGSILIFLLGVVAPSAVTLNGEALSARSDALIIPPVGIIIGLIISVVIAGFSAAAFSVFKPVLPLGKISVAN